MADLSQTTAGLGGLTDADWRAVIAAIERCPAATRAVLFGSRATGKHKPASDIDIALYGDITLTDLARIVGALEESSLAVEVDLVVVGSITTDPLQENIARDGRVVWEREAER